MRTLVTDDFAERPEHNPHLSLANAMHAHIANLTTSGNINAGATIIVTTGGYVAGDPPPPEPYRTQAWVEKPKAIEAGDGDE